MVHQSTRGTLWRFIENNSAFLLPNPKFDENSKEENQSVVQNTTLLYGSTALVGLLWVSDRLVADPVTRQQTTPTQETDIHALGGIQNRNTGKRKAAGTILIL
jgi:hypothetical protein